MFATDAEKILVAIILVLILVECLFLGVILDRILKRRADAPPGDRYLTRAKWILFANSFCIAISSIGLAISGMIWMPLLLILAAAEGMLAFQRLDEGRLSDARLFEMLGAALTFVVAMISLGRAVVGTGMGPLHALFVFALAVIAAYVVFLIGRGQDWRNGRPPMPR